MPNIYFYSVSHLQNDEGALVVGIPAITEKAARHILDTEFLFHEYSPVNGHLYEVTYDRMQVVPKLQNNDMVIVGPNGEVWVKNL
jgi:hypothetical protein